MLKIQGEADRPLPIVAMERGSGVTVSSEDGKVVYEPISLRMRDRNRVFDAAEASLTILSAKGRGLEGRVFRRLPPKGSDGQDKVEGQVVFQGWGIELPLAGGQSFRANFVEYAASARVEFGKGQGQQQTGRVRLCVPSGQPNMFGDSTLKVSIEVVGRFIATER